MKTAAASPRLAAPVGAPAEDGQVRVVLRAGARARGAALEAEARAAQEATAESAGRAARPAGRARATTVRAAVGRSAVPAVPVDAPQVPPPGAVLRRARVARRVAPAGPPARGAGRRETGRGGPTELAARVVGRVHPEPGAGVRRAPGPRIVARPAGPPPGRAGVRVAREADGAMSALVGAVRPHSARTARNAGRGGSRAPGVRKAGAGPEAVAVARTNGVARPAAVPGAARRRARHPVPARAAPGSSRARSVRTAVARSCPRSRDAPVRPPTASRPDVLRSGSPVVALPGGLHLRRVAGPRRRPRRPRGIGADANRATSATR